MSGALGTAILSGMLASIADLTADNSGSLFAHFVGCVRRKDAATAISDRLCSHANAANVEILDGQNLRGSNKRTLSSWPVSRTCIRLHSMSQGCERY